MKKALFLFLFVCLASTVQAQNQVPHESVQITTNKGELQLSTLENGALLVNVPKKIATRIIKKKKVTYSEFGAVGDGKTDDINAIAATHAFANKNGLKVEADKDYTYYIGRQERTAIIQTDTDFGTARFIIDDTDVENRETPIFKVTSNLESFEIETLTSLQKNQAKIEVKLPQTCLLTVTNENVKHYIRYGLNPNNGKPQTDIFISDKDGNVDMNAPIIWDFEEITNVKVQPIDEQKLKITGGIFTTIANQEESKYTYYKRNITINRSNVIIDGLEHRITGEGDSGAPYNGFLSISDCAYIKVQNTILTGHKTYITIGRAGKLVSMGTYDLSAARALNVSFINCTQTNDINNRTYWGILGSNYCKNMLYDNCVLSRFDAHMGVANATIRNSTLGHMGINAIGSGTLLVENSTIQGWSLVNLRSDYGSTWQGEFIIRNCTFKPRGGTSKNLSLIGGQYSGQHDFGYICHMPSRITIENLHIDDSNAPAGYKGPAIFYNFNPKMNDASYETKYPNIITEEVVLKNISTESGKTLRLSDNTYMFKNVKITNK